MTPVRQREIFSLGKAEIVNMGVLGVRQGKSYYWDQRWEHEWERDILPECDNA
jgi:hypothetical protein